MAIATTLTPAEEIGWHEGADNRHGFFRRFV